MKKILSTLSIIVVSYLFVITTHAFDQRPDGHQYFLQQNHKTHEIEHLNQKFQEVTSAERVTIMDQSLRMPMMTLEVPNGWKLVQDVASNPNGSGYLKFHLSMESPEGEIHGFLPFSIGYFTMNQYGQNLGMGFEQLLFYLMHYCSQPFLEKFTPTQLLPDQEAMSSQMGMQAKQQNEMMTMQISQKNGIYLDSDFGIYKMEFKAFRKNVPYMGMLSAIKIGFLDRSPYMPGKYGTIFGGFILAPDNLYKKAIDRGDFAKIEVNPQWDQKRSQIIDMESQRMAQDHQAKMAQQRQQFQAHQQNMASMRQTFEQQNQDWYNRNFGSAGSSAYSGNASVTDAITGYTSFSDPYTGHQIKKEGHYDYWYTNEFGEYHGTNDPNFLPGNHYSGNWTSAQPLKPDH